MAVVGSPAASEVTGEEATAVGTEGAADRAISGWKASAGSWLIQKGTDGFQ